MANVVFVVAVKVQKTHVCTNATFCSFVIFTAKLLRDSRILLLPHIQTITKWKQRDLVNEECFPALIGPK